MKKVWTLEVILEINLKLISFLALHSKELVGTLLNIVGNTFYVEIFCNVKKILHVKLNNESILHMIPKRSHVQEGRVTLPTGITIFCDFSCLFAFCFVNIISFKDSTSF